MKVNQSSSQKKNTFSYAYERTCIYTHMCVRALCVSNKCVTVLVSGPCADVVQQSICRRVLLLLVDAADGRGGATPSLSASHAMMSCIPFDSHLHLLSRKCAQDHRYLYKLFVQASFSTEDFPKPSHRDQETHPRSPFAFSPPCAAFMFSVLALLHAFVRDHVEEGDYIPATTTITITITSPIKLIFNFRLIVKQNTISNKMMFECCVCSCL